MLEKKQKKAKKTIVLALMLVLVMTNTVAVLAKTLSGTTNKVNYVFTGSASQSGANIKATGKTYATITVGAKKDYVTVKVAKEYISTSGNKAVATVKEEKTNERRKVSLTSYVPKTINGKSATARVGHSFSHGTAAYIAYTIY